jgi:hypothetical protein
VASPFFVSLFLESMQKTGLQFTWDLHAFLILLSAISYFRQAFSFFCATSQ